MGAAAGTNQGRPKLETSHCWSPARIDPAWLATASPPSRPARIKRTPAISRTWRCVRCGRLGGRLERAERERADDARRAPLPCVREVRELLRRMLEARVDG